MNEKRSQEILKHIVQDKDYGISILKTLSLAECIFVANNILRSCIQKANENGNVNDSNFFSKMMYNIKSIIVDKVKNANNLWLVYCDATGYPYEVDKDMLVIYDYPSQKEIAQRLENTGFKVTIVDMDNNQFKNEIAHMYRNGYKSIRLINDQYEPYIIEREEIYPFDDFFKDDYITNPGLQISMISFFQEFRKESKYDLRANLLKSREDNMINNILHAEFMVPCTKIETEDELEISHPFIDISDSIQSEDGKPVIVVPVFTDGFELDKCYKDEHETMLYKYDELIALTDELEASGIIINCLGTSYYMSREMMKKII